MRPRCGATRPPPGPAAPRGQHPSAPSVAQWHHRKGVLMSLLSSRAPEAGSLNPAPRCQSNTPIPALTDGPSPPPSPASSERDFLKWRIPARDRLSTDTLFRGWQARLKCPAVPTHTHTAACHSHFLPRMWSQPPLHQAPCGAHNAPSPARTVWPPGHNCHHHLLGEPQGQCSPQRQRCSVAGLWGWDSELPLETPGAWTPCPATSPSPQMTVAAGGAP